MQKRSKFESPEGVVLYNCSGLVDMQILKEGKEQILLLIFFVKLEEQYLVLFTCRTLVIGGKLSVKL